MEEKTFIAGQQFNQIGGITMKETRHHPKLKEVSGSSDCKATSGHGAVHGKAVSCLNTEGPYRGLDPRGKIPVVELAPLNERPKNLVGRKVYVVGAQTQSLTERISKALKDRVPSSDVKYLEIENAHIERPEIWREVREEADAAVLGVGWCGGVSPKIAAWTADLEKAGISSVFLAYNYLENTVQLAATGKGMPFLRRVMLSSDVDDHTNIKHSVDLIIDALTRPLVEDEQKTGTYAVPEPPRIAVTGTMEELLAFYEEHHFNDDGLPVLIPTEERVEEMLKGTSHPPDEVVGTMWPEAWEFTVEKVAVNAVMAGCKPEYMPVLLGMAEAFGKEIAFSTQVKSSTSFSFMTLVSGPIAKAIGMNASFNAMGPGNRANASIGRALRLFIVNLGGGSPGINLMSNEGNPMMYSWCFAEDNENSPWPPFHTSTGFGAEESCVTVFSGGWLWSESWKKKGLDGLIQQLNLIPAPFGAGVVISPDVAKSFRKDGLVSRDDLQLYLWENTTQTFKEWSDTTWYDLMKGAAERGYRGRRFWPEDYFHLPPNATVKTYAKAEHIHVIVATRGETVMKLQLPSTVSVEKWRVD